MNKIITETYWRFLVAHTIQNYKLEVSRDPFIKKQENAEDTMKISDAILTIAILRAAGVVSSHPSANTGKDEFKTVLSCA